MWKRLGRVISRQFLPLVHLVRAISSPRSAAPSVDEMRPERTMNERKGER